MIYEKTKDPNIVKQINIFSKEIDIKKLEAEIEDIKKIDYTLLQYPKDASLELKQAIDMYNEPTIAMQIQNEEILKEKKDLLKKCLLIKNDNIQRQI